MILRAMSGGPAGLLSRRRPGEFRKHDRVSLNAGGKVRLASLAAGGEMLGAGEVPAVESYTHERPDDDTLLTVLFDDGGHQINSGWLELAGAPRWPRADFSFVPTLSQSAPFQIMHAAPLLSGGDNARRTGCDDHDREGRCAAPQSVRSVAASDTTVHPRRRPS